MTLTIPPKDIEEAVEAWVRENLGDEVAQKIKSFTFVVNRDNKDKAFVDGYVGCTFKGCEIELE